jgi:hypothetical protein
MLDRLNAAAASVIGVFRGPLFSADRLRRHHVDGLDRHVDGRARRAVAVGEDDACRLDALRWVFECPDKRLKGFLGVLLRGNPEICPDLVGRALLAAAGLGRAGLAAGH